MSENQRIIEKIIFSFKEEMSRIEHGNIFTLLARKILPHHKKCLPDKRKLTERARNTKTRCAVFCGVRWGQ